MMMHIRQPEQKQIMKKKNRESNTTSKHNFIVADECECGFVDTDTGRLCCKNCGRMSLKMKIISGEWKYKRVEHGKYWPFKSIEYVKDKFIKSEHC